MSDRGVRSSLVSEFMRGVSGGAAIRIGSALLSLATTMILARHLGAEGFGLYSFAFSLSMLLALPAQAGLPILVLRETATYQIGGQWGFIRGLSRFGNIFTAISSLIMAAIGLMTAWVLGIASAELALYACSFCLIPLVALGNIRGATLQGLRHVVLGQLPENIIRPLIWLSLLIAVIAAGPTLTPLSAMTTHVVGSLVAVSVGAAILAKTAGPQLKSNSPQFDNRGWLKSLIPLSIMSGIQVVNLQVGTIILGLAHAKDEVGVYRASAQVSLLVGFAISIVGTAVAPHMARLYGQNQIEKLQSLVRKATLVTTILAIPAVCICVFFGDALLLKFFGEDFVSGYKALVALCLAQLVVAFSGPVSFLMNMTKNENETVKGSCLSAISNFLLCCLLVPVIGALGAALSVAFSVSVQNLYLVRRARVVMKIKCGPI